MRPKKNNGKKSNGLFLAALVVLAVILIVIFFLVKKDQILTNLKETDFFGRVFGSTPEVIQNHESKAKKDEVPLKDDIVIDLNEEDEAIPLPEIKEENKPSVEKETIKEEVKSEKKEEIKKEVQEEKPKAVPMTSVELCFLEIDGNGMVTRRLVKRSVPKGDSPLTTAINLLLQGPDKSNKNEAKLSSLIPDNSKLLSARVKDGIAYLNFNEDFEFTTYGVEGSIHQLEQIVYTATAFSTVDKVQFLIEGKQREYLGSEGQRIGTPLSRADF